MSDLKTRLRRLTGGAGKQGEALEAAEAAEAARIAPPPNAQRLPSGCTWIENEAGGFVMRERVFPADMRHGLYRLDELAGLFPALTRVTKRHALMRPVESHRRLLFFDTETTGLGVGAGNVPFMLGIGFYREDDALVVRQLFVRNPGEERAMLVHFGELLSSFTHLVSYNGRAFDWPIIKNRYVLNRIPFVEDGPEHLDLLYISRNLWRGSLQSCRLGTVEEARLGIIREADISGALAPTLYFQYLADGDERLMEGVFRHNETDVLTLATLAIHLCRMLSGKLVLADLSGDELFRMGLWLDEVGQPRLAGEAFAELLRRPAAEARPFYTRLASVYKKRKQYDVAVPLWHRAAEESGGALRGMASGGIEALVELAMYYEHHAKKIDKALECVEEALNRWERRLALKRATSKERGMAEQLHRRRARLLAKLYKAAESEPTLFSL